MLDSFMFSEQSYFLTHIFIKIINLIIITNNCVIIILIRIEKKI
jgi:hypothetical protein